MKMSAGGSEGLFKLAESAAPDEHRIMPSERRYLPSSTTVSVEEAVALMKKRKMDPSARIKGGLDDESDYVRIRKQSSPKAVQSLKNAESGEISELVKKVLEYGQQKPEADQKQEEKPAKRRAARDRSVDSDILKAICELALRVPTVQDVVDGVLKGQAARLQSDPVEEPVDALKVFKAGSHSVTFMLGGMEFTVKCLNMVLDKESHTLVFVFDADGDSFFTPPMRSELMVKFDGRQHPGKLYYFGMNFSVKDLGLKFLGFLYDDQEDAGQEI